MKVRFNITKWSSGYGIDIETDKHDYGFAGACGGGVGITEKTFTTSYVQLERLREIIDEILGEKDV